MTFSSVPVYQQFSRMAGNWEEKNITYMQYTLKQGSFWIASGGLSQICFEYIYKCHIFSMYRLVWTDSHRMQWGSTSFKCPGASISVCKRSFSISVLRDEIWKQIRNTICFPIVVKIIISCLKEIGQKLWKKKLFPPSHLIDRNKG